MTKEYNKAERDSRVYVCDGTAIPGRKVDIEQEPTAEQLLCDHDWTTDGLLQSMPMGDFEVCRKCDLARLVSIVGKLIRNK